VGTSGELPQYTSAPAGPSKKPTKTGSLPGSLAKPAGRPVNEKRETLGTPLGVPAPSNSSFVELTPLAARR